MPLWNQWRRGNEENTGEDAGGRAPLPQVGDTVSLHAGGDFEVGVYQARVRAIGPRRILLESQETTTAHPEDSAALTSALPPRTPLTLSFICNDNLYQCETRVVGPTKVGTLAVSRPRIVTKVQRRQFYRLPLQSPTTFRVRGDSGSTCPAAALCWRPASRCRAACAFWSASPPESRGNCWMWSRTLWTAGLRRRAWPGFI